MGMLDMFGINNEEQSQLQAEKRQMMFQREQNTQALSLPEEKLELIHEQGKSDLLKWQQDLDGELMDLVNRLRGYVMGEDGEYRREPGVVPLCNNKFIVDVVIPQCKPFLSRNLINSTFTEERILLDLKNTSNDIMSNMADGFDIYDMKFQNYDVILRMVKNVIKAGAFRALDGFTKKTDSTVHKMLESRFENQGQQNKRGFGFKN
jgi:hypothetical protein